MAAGAAGFHEAAVGVELAVASQHGDVEAGAFFLFLSVEAAQVGIGMFALAEGLFGVDQHAALHGLAAQQHAVTHGIAVGEGELDALHHAADAHIGFDDGTFFSMAGRGFHGALVNQAGLAADAGAAVFLQGADIEAHPLLAAHVDYVDVGGV